MYKKKKFFGCCIYLKQRYFEYKNKNNLLQNNGFPPSLCCQPFLAKLCIANFKEKNVPYGKPSTRKYEVRLMYLVWK